MYRGRSHQGDEEERRMVEEGGKFGYAAWYQIDLNMTCHSYTRNTQERSMTM
jgi:hypothetical protein